MEGYTMLKFINKFRKDENGAVTVDWVVLTAAVVALAGAAYTSIETGASNLTESTGTFIEGKDPA
jgi:Flp pilus assembly pilin Flp